MIRKYNVGRNVNTLRANCGHGLVISFKKGARLKVKERRHGVIVFESPEQSGYDTLAKPMNQLAVSYEEQTERIYSTISGADEADEIASEDSESIKEKVGSSEQKELNVSKFEVTNTFSVEDTGKVRESSEAKDVQTEKARQSHNENDEQTNRTKTSHEAEEEKHQETETSLATAKKPDTNLYSERPLIGVENNQEVYWEFHNNQLSNRHLIIGGRSGQGKNYFIQSLLRDLSRTNQSAVVIDYSSSNTRTQLDLVFLKDMGDRFRERIVYHEGFSLNLFLRREKEVAGVAGKEKPTEVARRVVDVFSSVYKNGFGPQQISALYEAVKRGLERYDDKMKMEHLLEILEELDGYANSVLSSIITRIVQFVDIDSFGYESRNQWEEYFAPGGNITVIQLAGYDQDEIKKLMAEFILWDFWYYTQNGTKDKPIPVILDEAQNLDFSDGSPSAKILREGRKFGWSAWFATQTFNNFSKDELTILDNAGTKVYFNPAESEVCVLANRIGRATPEELWMLQKGQCLVLGQFMQRDQKLSNPTYYIVKVPAMNTR